MESRRAPLPPPTKGEREGSVSLPPCRRRRAEGISWESATEPRPRAEPRGAAAPRERGNSAVAPCKRRHVAGEQGEVPPFCLPVTSKPGEGWGSADNHETDEGSVVAAGEAEIFC